MCAYPARRVAVSLTDGASRCDVDDDPNDTSAQTPATTADYTSTRRPETTTAMREYPTSALKALFQWE